VMFIEEPERSFGNLEYLTAKAPDNALGRQ
jgi:hypothetical protein